MTVSGTGFGNYWMEQSDAVNPASELSGDSRKVDMEQAIDILVRTIGGRAAEIDPIKYSVVIKVRLPRILMGVIVGILMNNIIPFHESERYGAAERKKTEDTLKYHMALSVFRRLRRGKNSRQKNLRPVRKFWRRSAIIRAFAPGWKRRSGLCRNARKPLYRIASPPAS